MRTAPALLLALASMAVGCSFDSPSADAPVPDRVTFESVIYPQLLRDCGFPDCHGSSERFFQVFGPNRARLDPAATCGGLATCAEPATPAELDRTYDRARSMLASAGRPEDTLLLRKPLEVDRGGAPHLGLDAYGQDVYPSPDATGYENLLNWASTASVFRGAP